MQDLKNKNILITGGAGFIGFNMINYLLQNGFDSRKIFCVDKITYASYKGAILFFKKHEIHFTKKDINDLDSKYIKDNNIEVIINFAAETHVDNSINDSTPFIQTNINGLHNILLLVKKHNLRLHQVSTDEVYGGLKDNDEKFTTSTPLNPSSPYSSSKAAGDLLTNAFIKTFGIKATISRCSNNYGPYQLNDNLIPKTITLFIESKKIGIYGDGKNVRDWIHVNDHNSAVLAILENTESGVFNIGSQNEIANIDIVNLIGDLMDVKQEDRIEFVEDRKGHDWRYAINPESMLSIGWKPSVKFSEGVKEVIKFYEENNS